MVQFLIRMARQVATPCVLFQEKEIRFGYYQQRNRRTYTV